MYTPQYTFSKGERLTKKQHIDALFQSEEAFVCYPFRVLYCNLATEIKTYPTEILISIPKRRIKLAVNRNLLKRRTREAYRLQKSDLYNFLLPKNNSFAVGIVYIADEIVSYEDIYKAMGSIISELKKRL